ATADGRWVATLATATQMLTVPGGEVSSDALMMVTVAATHKRRGILTTMLTASLDEAHARGDAVAILHSAEWPIYGRFGYAPATLDARYRFRPRDPGAAID